MSAVSRRTGERRRTEMTSQEKVETQAWDVDRGVVATDVLAAQAYGNVVAKNAAAIRLPELFRNQLGALYAVANRNGVAVVALRTTSLSGQHLIQLMTYRLAQYLLAGFVDPRLVYERQLEYEPLNHTSPDDVHVIAGNAVTGELLC